VILDELSEQAVRGWYIHWTIANRWLRNVLVHQIESGLINREGRKVTNFSTTLPGEQSELSL